MTTLLLDLWHDLREKRLWPVAVALLASIAAVPLLVFKPASHPTTTDASSASTKGAESLPVVTLADNSGHVSKLDVFSQKNPFKSMADVNKLSSAPTPSPASGSSSSAGAGGSGGSGGSGSGGSGGSGGPTVSRPSGPSTTSTAISNYTFRPDLRFGPRGHEKAYKGVKQLDMLPDSKSPVIVFMGMTSDFKKAVFLVDTSKYQAAGEGVCKPSADTCSFVELSLKDSGNEETLAALDGGSDYTLKLTGIKRVSLTAEQAKGAAKDKSTPSSPKAKSADTDGGATGGKAHGLQSLDHLFELPSFASQG